MRMIGALAAATTSAAKNATNLLLTPLLALIQVPPQEVSSGETALATLQPEKRSALSANAIMAIAAMLGILLFTLYKNRARLAAALRPQPSEMAAVLAYTVTALISMRVTQQGNDDTAMALAIAPTPHALMPMTIALPVAMLFAMLNMQTTQKPSFVTDGHDVNHVFQPTEESPQAKTSSAPTASADHLVEKVRGKNFFDHLAKPEQRTTIAEHAGATHDEETKKTTFHDEPAVTRTTTDDRVVWKSPIADWAKKCEAIAKKAALLREKEQAAFKAEIKTLSSEKKDAERLNTLEALDAAFNPKAIALHVKDPKGEAKVRSLLDLAAAMGVAIYSSAETFCATEKQCIAIAAHLEHGFDTVVFEGVVLSTKNLNATVKPGLFQPLTTSFTAIAKPAPTTSSH